MAVTPSSHHGFLRNNDVGADVHMVLIVKPNSLANPRVVPNVKLPRKLHSSSWTEYDTMTDFCSEKPQDTHAQSGANLPRIRDEQEFSDCPQVDDSYRPVP